VDAMVRASLSARCREKVSDLEKWTGLFFGEWQDQQGLKEFLEIAVRAPTTTHFYLYEFRLTFQYSNLLHCLDLEVGIVMPLLDCLEFKYFVLHTF
jgi:hypothetical protein